MSTIEHSIVLGIAKEISRKYIETYGGKLEIQYRGSGNYFLFLTHDDISFSEQINIVGMSETVWKQYIQCRIHEIAAKLIRKLHPIR
jgi:hypothetical protein